MNSTPSEPLKKTASARKILTVAGLQALAIVFVVAGLAWWLGDSTAQVQVGAASFQVHVADSEQERQKGLSHRTHLADNYGMLFVFPRDDQWAIWMKDMKVPLDIIWLDAHKNVVHVEHSVSPDSYPAYFAPATNARYVLEIASGRAKKMGIQPGVTAQFDVSAATK